LPDITPLDFFLQGYVKDKVFSTPVPDITNLKARITDAFATITEDMYNKEARKNIFMNIIEIRFMNENTYKVKSFRCSKAIAKNMYTSVEFWRSKEVHNRHCLTLLIPELDTHTGRFT
jgi:hypothetical protein